MKYIILMIFIRTPKENNNFQFISQENFWKTHMFNAFHKKTKGKHTISMISQENHRKRNMFNAFHKKTIGKHTFSMHFTRTPLENTYLQCTS